MNAVYNRDLQNIRSVRISVKSKWIFVCVSNVRSVSHIMSNTNNKLKTTTRKHMLSHLNTKIDQYINTLAMRLEGVRVGGVEIYL